MSAMIVTSCHGYLINLVIVGEWRLRTGQFDWANKDVSMAKPIMPGNV